jgi:hypothetical protein
MIIEFDMRKPKYFCNYVYMLIWLTDQKIKYTSLGFRLRIDFENKQDASAFKLLFM